MKPILDKAKLDEAIENCFLHNKEQKTLHVTPDGNCFYGEHKSHSDNHAKLIGHKSVEVKREDYVTDAMQVEYDKMIADKANAAAEKVKADAQAAADAQAKADADAKIAADKATKDAADAQAKADADAKIAADKATKDAADAQAKADADAKIAADAQAKADADAQAAADKAAAIEKATADLETAKTGGDEKAIADAQAALDALTKEDDAVESTDKTTTKKAGKK